MTETTSVFNAKEPNVNNLRLFSFVLLLYVDPRQHQTFYRQMFFFTFPEFPDCERLPSLIETSQVPPVLLEAFQTADGSKFLYYVLMSTTSRRRTIRTVLN